MTIWGTQIVCCIPKATNTHTRNIWYLLISTATMLAPTQLSVTLHVHCLSCSVMLVMFSLLDFLTVLVGVRSFLWHLFWQNTFSLFVTASFGHFSDFLFTFSSVFILSGSYNNLVYNWNLGNVTNKFYLNLFNLVTDMFEIKLTKIACQFAMSPHLVTCNNSRTAEICFMRLFRPRYLPTFVDTQLFVAKSTTKIDPTYEDA
jgi:hypothetical protein